MTAALTTDHVHALLAERGWRLVGERGDKALVECIECEARSVRTWNAVRGRLRACPHPAVDDGRTYDEDLVCRRFVHHFGAMTLQEIGDALKVSRERVRQIEEGVLDRIVKPFEDAGIDRETAREHLRRVFATRPDSARQRPEWKLERYEAKRRAGRK